MFSAFCLIFSIHIVMDMISFYFIIFKDLFLSLGVCGYTWVWDSRRGQWIPWSWSCRELLAVRCGHWKLNSDPLQEQQALFTTEPSLQLNLCLEKLLAWFKTVLSSWKLKAMNFTQSTALAQLKTWESVVSCLWDSQSFLISLWIWTRLFRTLQ